ncbi:MAG: hypothetical protein HYZ28_04910 [Myxococcales bacterium]|nr:hypothetical protein [Myxococcales bacterium]
MRKKVLVSITARDLARIDAAARRAGQSRSAYICRAALKEAERPAPRPMDDPRFRQLYGRLEELRKRIAPMGTAQVLAARDRGRRS